MAQSLYGCSFFPGMCGGCHCRYGIGAAGSFYPAFGRCHRLFEDAFFLAVRVALYLAGDLAFWGPGVTDEMCRKYSIYSLVDYSAVHGDFRCRYFSTKDYPIFLFMEEGKVYMPFAERDYRFRFYGRVRDNYLFGFEQLKRDYEEMNEELAVRYVYLYKKRNKYLTKAMEEFIRVAVGDEAFQKVREQREKENQEKKGSDKKGDK